MLPPRLIRRLVLAPLAIVIAIAVAVLFPLLALGTLAFGALTRARPGRGPRPARCRCCRPSRRRRHQP